jgi:hypothetical protein
LIVENSKAIKTDIKKLVKMSKSRQDGKIDLPERVAFTSGPTSMAWIAENEEEVVICHYSDPRKAVDVQVRPSFPLPCDPFPKAFF